MAKNRKALSDDQMKLVSGGGTGGVEEYRAELMRKYNCSSWDLYDYATQEEIQRCIYMDKYPASSVPGKKYFWEFWK